MMAFTIGSERHRDLFCREFIDTHEKYDVATLPWPELDDASLARLRSLPFWEEAVSTELATAAKVSAQARLEDDPFIHEAVALQGEEEARHSALLDALLARYDIPVQARPLGPLPKDIEWAFLRTEYGECFDSFFAFGLFAIARESSFLPSAFIKLFEPIVQEEARHILFFVNWLAYRRAQLPWWQKPRLVGRCLTGMTIQAWSRLQTARGMGDGGDFTLTGHEALSTDIKPRSFLELCLNENERRLGVYDRRLLRPQLVPTIARTVCAILPR
jgi:hypothetical protein